MGLMTSRRTSGPQLAASDVAERGESVPGLAGPSTSLARTGSHRHRPHGRESSFGPPPPLGRTLPIELFGAAVAWTAHPGHTQSRGFE